MEDLPEGMDVLPLRDHHNQSLQIDPNQLDKQMNGPYLLILRERDDAERHQIAQTSPPAAPPPTEERLFTDWSSEGSPRERTSQHVQSARSIESRRTEQITREPGDDEIRRHTLSDVSTTPSAQGSKPLPVKVDPGADVNTIPLTKYRKLFPTHFTRQVT